MTRADEYKKKIKGYLYAKNYGGVVEESSNHWNADIIGCNFRGETNEFEIKVALSDLRGEVKAIHRAIRGGIYRTRSSQVNHWSYNNVDVAEKVSLTKLEKHYCYLVGNQKRSMTFSGTMEEEKLVGYETDDVNCFVPSKFYFAVPTELVDQAKKLLTDIPYYGIMDADTGDIKKSARKLPRANIRPVDYFNLFIRACTEWRPERRRIEYLEDIIENGHRIHIRKKLTWTDLRGETRHEWI